MEQDNGAGTITVAAGAQSPGGASPTPPSTVDLTQIPEFRSFQASQDRKFAAMQQTNQQLSQQLTELAGKVGQREMVDVENLEPAEQVEFYRRQSDERQKQLNNLAEQQRNLAKITEIVNRSGLDWQKEPVLAQALSLGATPSGVEAVQAAVFDILTNNNRTANQRATEAEAEARRKIDAERQRGKLEGIESTGATVTSLGSGAPVIQETERQRVILAGKKQYAKLRGKGETPDYLRFMDWLRSVNLMIDDVMP